MAERPIWGYEVADYVIGSGLVRDGAGAPGPLPPVWVDTGASPIPPVASPL